jgi:hypothetical protein
MDFSVTVSARPDESPDSIAHRLTISHHNLATKDRHHRPSL